MLIPAAILASAISTPEVLMTLLLLLVTALVGASVLAALAAAVHGPLVLLMSRRAPRPAAGAQEATLQPAPQEVLLRRRYLAGELTTTGYADAMMALLKQRYQRGDLALVDYEMAVDRLLAPRRSLEAAAPSGAHLPSPVSPSASNGTNRPSRSPRVDTMPD